VNFGWFFVKLLLNIELLICEHYLVICVISTTINYPAFAKKKCVILSDGDFCNIFLHLLINWYFFRFALILVQVSPQLSEQPTAKRNDFFSFHSQKAWVASSLNFLYLMLNKNGLKLILKGILPQLSFGSLPPTVTPFVCCQSKVMKVSCRYSFYQWKWYFL